MTKAELSELFTFRNVKEEEADQTIEIENICFQSNEACTPEAMAERASQAQETFLVAVDKKTDKIAGFLNGIATDEDVFRDEFFTNITLHNKNGKNIMLLGLDVLRVSRTGACQRNHGAISCMGEGAGTETGGTYLPG